MYARPTWAEIDLSALIHNLHLVENIVKPKKVIPVIKADAYGHGAIEVMNTLIHEGIDYFAVSLLEEAIELREVNQSVGIMMLGPILNSQFDLCHHHKIDLTIYDEDIAMDVLSYEKPLRLHVKIDSGMHRYGIESRSFIHDWILKLEKAPHQFLGIYSHFATANEQDNHFVLQVNRSMDMITTLPKLPPMIHLSNSAASFHYEPNFKVTTHVRLGISLYGLSLDEDKMGLRPIMSLKTKVVTIKTLQAGESLGYGATYTAEKDEKIAILPIGYADGFIRKNKGGYVEINHHKYKLVGIICMDACFVKIDDKIKVGDVVTLFGGLISIDDVAKRLSTINYEVVTNISKRVPRIYMKGAML
jgi:alanine racemase